MATIKDSVHDHIEIEGVAAALLDTPAVQRLRRIRQLGTVSYVYPSANHTRFEHSLGVYHLACQALDGLGIHGQQAERVRAAALLHDVGHSPFSHNVEAVIHRHTGQYHDDVADLLEENPVGDVLRSHDLDPETIADLIAGDGQYGQLVSGELDVDRMDYLVRDAHHTGVPYGTIDHGRLVRELTFENGQLVLQEGNVQAAESLLIARALMNPTVYSHHVARISKSLLRRGTERLIDEESIPAATVRRMDDSDLLVALRTHEATEGYANALDERDLFKRAVWAELRDVPDKIIDADHETVRGLEDEIAAKADVRPAHVIIDVPGRPTMTESTTRVVVGSEVRRLDEQSPLVEALRAAQQSQWRLGVYAPNGRTEQVGHAAASVLGLDIEGALVSEVRGTHYATLDEFDCGPN
ncbi:HD domain-containing protein [Natranaeroarchaeum sulfidigenes]|uniref:HD superfamily phosphohydrolase n=1 Tax=Natranaeroarchaeum sulfidigenes TaxID=2784880 RepID=A0A897MUF7_9EURY|nr:HD domain-containing protein [Natranaeroarchaeum sulfidigenes]QSG02589.1 HD superfamily phosphohydrolase [Natranaeroarchaeum sulfidigenes]